MGKPDDRVSSGIKGFDVVTNGGYEKGSIAMIGGEAGTGKTTFALQFIYQGAKFEEEPSVFITFEEHKESIFKHYANYGWDLEALEKKGLLKIIKYHPHQVLKMTQEGGGIIRDVIDDIGAKRLALDSLTGYTMLFESSYKMRESVLELFEMLREWGTTSVLTAEMSTGLHSSGVMTGIEYLTDAVVYLYHPRHEGARTRAMEIFKMRGTKYQDRIFQMSMDKEGITVHHDKPFIGKF